MKKEREPTYSHDFVRDISEVIYREGLEKACSGDVAKMIAKDGDNGEKLRVRAGFYDGLTHSYLKALDIPIDAGSAEA